MKYFRKTLLNLGKEKEALTINTEVEPASPLEEGWCAGVADSRHWTFSFLERSTQRWIFISIVSQGCSIKFLTRTELELNENGNQTASHHRFYHDGDLTSSQCVLRKRKSIQKAFGASGNLLQNRRKVKKTGSYVNSRLLIPTGLPHYSN